MLLSTWISPLSHAVRYQVKGETKITDSGVELIKSVVSDEDNPFVAVKVIMAKIDPHRHSLKLCQAESSDEWMTSRDWARSNHLDVAMCASMYHKNGDSVGYLACKAKLESDKIIDHYGAFLAFDPKNPRDLPVAIFDRNEVTLDWMTHHYSTLIQGMFMVKEGKAIPWKKKRHSASAYATTWDGQLIFVHFPQTTSSMSELNKILSLETFGIRSAIFADGSLAAALWVDGQGSVGECTLRKGGCCSAVLNFLVKPIAQCFYPDGKKVPRVMGATAHPKFQEKEKSD